MYQALYRKYRPKTLEDVVGQNTIVKIIKNSINRNQVNHAYLFTGPRGTGKTSIAKILARIVNCENPQDCVPCGKCSSCKQQNNGDIIEIDAASNNGVDEIRELRNKVNLVPSYGKYKVYIIDEVHMLTVGAFNALLKTLEEPPAHIIFILATTDPEKIPETILSRCQRFDFKKISNEEIVENLKKISQIEKIQIEPEALLEIAKQSDGGMRDSVGMLDQAKAFCENIITSKDIHEINGTITERDLEQIENLIIEKKLEELLKIIDKLNVKGKNFNKLIEEMISYIRNLILYKKVPKYFKEQHNSIETYKIIAEKINAEELINQIKILNEYSKEMKTANNTKLMFELALIELVSEKEQENNNKREDKTTINVEKVYNTTLKNTEKLVNSEKDVDKKVKNSTNNKKTVKKNEKTEEFIRYIKKIRIDNTLSKFNKKEYMEIKKKIEEKLNELLLNPDYSHSASILLDGQLKAASTENLIYVYKTNSVSHDFNEKLIELEKTVEKALNKKYNLIATDIDEWEKIKDEFNNKKRQFKYTPEEFDLETVLAKESGDIIAMFEDIIEYN